MQVLTAGCFARVNQTAKRPCLHRPQLLGIRILQKDDKAQKELLPTKHSSMCLRRASREPNVSWQSVVIQSHVRPKRHRTCCNDELFLICFGSHLYSLHANRIASTRLVLPRMVCWASPCTVRRQPPPGDSSESVRVQRLPLSPSSST